MSIDSGLTGGLNGFLEKCVHPWAFESVKQTCVEEEIYTLEILVGLWNENKLEDLFKRGTAFSISNGLAG